MVSEGLLWVQLPAGMTLPGAPAHARPCALDTRPSGCSPAVSRHQRLAVQLGS